MKKLLIAFLLLVAGSTGVLAQDTSYKVRVVYFYPADYTPDQRYIDKVAPYIKEVRDWYYYILGSGKSFSVSPVEVIKGKKNAADYGTGVSIWNNVMSELGFSCGQKTTLLVVLARPIDFGGGSSCGSDYSGGGNNGIVMVGETSFDAELVAASSGVCPNGNPLGDPGCSADGAKGGWAHEIGHSFSLPHPQGCGSASAPIYCGDTVTWAWWNWPNVGLLDRADAPEKATLENLAFFWDTSPAAPQKTFFIQASGDDGTRGSDLISLSVSDDAVGKPFNSHAGYRSSFLRFTGVNVPQGAKINQASITFVPRDLNLETVVNSKFSAQAADNPPTIISLIDWDSRPRTAAQVFWDNMSAWNSDLPVNSVDITPVISEIINRPGWVAGNAILIFWDDNNSTNGAGRVARSYDYARVYAPRLNIDYVPPAKLSPSPTSSSNPIQPDTIPPTVSITAPTDGSTVARNTAIQISASASDNVGVAKVEFRVNNSLKCTDLNSPYSCSWKVPRKVDATYTIQAKAFDGAGNVATHAVNIKTAR